MNILIKTKWTFFKPKCGLIDHVLVSLTPEIHSYKMIIYHNICITVLFLVLLLRFVTQQDLTKVYACALRQCLFYLLNFYCRLFT